MSERSSRLAARVQVLHRRALGAAGVLAVGSLFPAGLSRSRFHGVIEAVWPRALFDTTLLFWLLVALLLALGAAYALRRAGPRRYLQGVVVGGMCLVLLFLAEGGIRLFKDPRTPRELAADVPIYTQANGRYEPNRVGTIGGAPFRTNEHGLRGPSIPQPKPPGTTRLLVLGDSFTFGAGVREEDTWPFRLAALLGERFPARRFDVINTSHNGFHAQDQADELAAFGSLLDPDLVLVGACQNDHWILTAQLDRAERWRGSFVPPILASAATARSALGALVAIAYDKALITLGVRAEQKETLLRLAEPGPEWEAFLDAYRGMRAETDARGLPPPLVQVLVRPAQDGVMEDGGELRARYVADIGTTGVGVFDALAAFQAHAGEYLVLNAQDPHPNAQAHRIYAEAFLAELEQRGLLASDGPLFGEN